MSQQNQTAVNHKVIGYWEGAFIKNNSYQKFDIQFYEEDSTLKSLQIIKEWHPQFGEFVLPVQIDSLNEITFNTGLGKATMKLDTNSLELIGSIDNSNPSIYVHLKKAPTPPKSDFTIKEVFIKYDSVSIYGHLHEPNGKSKTAIVLVGGRSCYAGSTKYDLYAKLLREYGITVLAYNKRGTGKSTGDCSLATISDLASDLAACKDYLSNHPANFEKIGVLGSSAGAWVMAKAEEQTDFDFMISMVGPATSVLDQQLQSMTYGAEFYSLIDSAKADLSEYTNLMFEASPTIDSFNKFKKLLDRAEKDGWLQLLDDTDIPSSEKGISDLWVRRHNYDPQKTLASFNNPFLAIYGEIDWIVPYEENIELLREYFKRDNDLLSAVVAHDAEHGTETKGKNINLSDNTSYWRFFRISPIVQVSIIDFLHKHQLIEID